MIENHEYADNGYSYVFEPRIYEGRSIRRIGRDGAGRTDRRDRDERAFRIIGLSV